MRSRSGPECGSDLVLELVQIGRQIWLRSGTKVGPGFVKVLVQIWTDAWIKTWPRSGTKSRSGPTPFPDSVLPHGRNLARDFESSLYEIRLRIDPAPLPRFAPRSGTGTEKVTAKGLGFRSELDQALIQMSAQVWARIVPRSGPNWVPDLDKICPQLWTEFGPRSGSDLAPTPDQLWGPDLGHTLGQI